MSRHCYAFLIIPFVMLIAPGLCAQESKHPIEHEEIHQKFYRDWMMPDNRTMSCCNNDDCSPAESKFENGQWLARKVGDDGPFTPVPPSKIEHDRDTPDGRSHVCGRGSGGSLAVFCFILGAGG